MEGKAGVRMDSRRGKSRGKSNRPLKRSLRRAVAWLLVFCMCMANMNSAAFAAEIATASNALMAATPSDAKATDSDAMEILMPEEVISGEDLATEAARAISEGNEFDFDSEIQVKKDDQGKDEGYEELFKGRRSFVLFADNGNGGRIQGDNPNAYGYILVQVDEKDYKAFEEEAGAAKATNSNATDSDAAERSWTLTGDEELVFLYINADDGSVTFTLNIENLQADDIVVPSYSELREEQKAEEEESKEESEANNPAAQPAEDGSENGGSAGGSGSGSGSAGSSDSAGDMEEIEDADKPDGSSDGQGSESGTDGGSEDSTDGAGQGSEDAGNSDSSDGAEDADKPDDSDDGQNGGQDAGNSAEDGNGSQSGSGSDTGSGDTDSGKAEGSGDAGSQKPDDSDDGQNSGSDHGSDTGNSGSGTEGDKNSGSGSEGNTGSGNTGSSDKGDSGKGDSNKGDSGSSSSDKGSSDTGNSGSSSDKGSSDKGGSSDTAKLSKSSYDVPVVMGPNPNAEFESDEFGDDISFDEWQEMMEEAEEEEEEDYEDYIEETDLAYEDEDGTTYLGMSMLPAVSATVKKEKKANPIARLLRMKAAAEETPAVVMAGTAALSDLVPSEDTYYKQIEANGDGTYRLHLGITGGDQQGLDIVLVIDLSNSMDDGISEDSSDSRLKVLKDTLGYYKESYNSRPGKPTIDEKSGFIDDLFEQSPNSRFSIVTYSTYASTELDWTEYGMNGSGQQTIKEAIGELQANGGTNYEAGLYQAMEVLKERGNSSNIPVVIFLSDGKPTYYYSDVDEFNGLEIGWSPIIGSYDNREGDGGSIDTDTGDGTIFAAGRFHEEMEALQGITYCVGFGIPELTSVDYDHYDPEQYLYAIAEGIDWTKDQDDKYIAPTESATTIEVEAESSELTTAFQSILNNLKMENVTISDTLSRFVTFAGDIESTSNVQVKKFTRNSSGELVGGEVLQEGTDYENIIFDKESGKIELVFGKDRKLQSGVVYELSFDIKLKEGTVITPDDKIEGDPNTDYRKNENISSGQRGVPTNADAYFSFGEDGTTRVGFPHPVIPAPATNHPEYKKYIKDNGNGTYTLTLDVKSDVGSVTTGQKDPTPTAVMFVIDKSGSMDQSFGSGNSDARREVVNSALELFFNQLSDGDYNIQFGGYKFSDSGERVNFNDWGWQDKYWETDTSNALSHLKLTSWETDGSTYPSQTLRSAISALENVELGENGKRYLIFLTDGEPGQNSYSFSKEEAENCYSAIKNLDSGTTFYAIQVANSDSHGFMESMVSNANFVDGVTAQKFVGNSADELNAAFSQMAAEISGSAGTTVPGAANVVITDTLSEYADMVNPGSITVSCSNGVQLSASDYTATYDQATRTVTVQFRADYELEKDATYSISFDVKPSEEAYNKFETDGGYYRNEEGGYILADGEEPSEENQYKGDEKTDDPSVPEDSQTSSGKPGFPANKKATLQYTYDGGTGRFEYPHPVLQIPEPVLPDEYNKRIEPNDDGTYSLTLDVTGIEGNPATVTTKYPVDLVFVIDKSLSMDYDIDGDEIKWWEDETESRKDIVNDALDEIIPDLCSQQYDIQIAGYQFSGSSTRVLDWSREEQQVLSGLKIAGTSSSTKPSQALADALDMLKTGSQAHQNQSNVKKYLIFMTDGEPTESEELSYYAISKNPVPGASIYTIGVSSDASTDLMEGIRSTAEGNGMTAPATFKGTSAQLIKDAFTQIKDEIISTSTPPAGISSVVIRDTLSEYADMVSTKDEVEVLRNGIPMQGTEFAEAVESVSINGKEITVTFKPGYALENGVTYGIRFKVKPSQYAEEQFAANGGYYELGDDGQLSDTETTGEEDTGSHSSEKPGFPSNEEATLSYSYDGYPQPDLEYRHPVLQVPEEGSFTVTKLIVDEDGNPAEGADPDQKFIIHIEKQTEEGEWVPYSSVALANGERSPEIRTEGEGTFRISEVVPMEYSLRGITVTKNADGQSEEVSVTQDGEAVYFTVHPADKLEVTVENILGHKGYFHSTADVKNTTTGDPEEPFSNGSAAQQAASELPRAEAAKKKVEIETEEGEPLV